MAVRLGVVADTHVGEFMDAVPAAVARALAGCDAILHAGDLSGPGVIEHLERIAPVVAVRGDHHLPAAPDLPRSVVIAACGRRVGLTHGQRSHAADAAVVAAGLIAPGGPRYRAGLARHLVRRLGALDLIVHGHWHEPNLVRVGGTLVFSPGAVCPWGSLHGGRAPRRGAAGLADRAVRRFRRRLGEGAMYARVGVVDLGRDGIRARSLRLPVE